MRERSRASRLPALAMLVITLAACGPPDGPQPISWDREPCAHCRMLISDPSFAAQLHTADGAIESFDDPGCLFARLEARQPRVHALWFHHRHEERWLPGDEVAFVRTTPTPMDFGFAAVDPGTPGSISSAEVREELRARSEAAR